MVKMRRITVTDLTEARMVLEPGIVRLACEKATREDMEALEKNIREASEIVERGSSSDDENITFHQIIAVATHNPVIETTTDTLFMVLREASKEIVDPSYDKSAASSAKAIKSHKRILTALRSGEPQKASSLMLEHVLEVQKTLKKMAFRTAKVKRGKTPNEKE
jgi:GntR family transcriptional repressor for pyruvate dehydrogenase complex